MSKGLNVYPLTRYAQMVSEDALKGILNSFSCPLNAEVEGFLKGKALQSSRLGVSQTYLVFDDATDDLLGYYTLVLKSYCVKGARLNSANRRLISRFAEEDANGNLNAAVYLIAQVGKNYAVDPVSRIAGSELLAMALDEFRVIKGRVGGKLVMVERESDRPKLFDFYNRNGFKSWTNRTNDKDGMVYDQMFAVLNDKQPPTGGPGS